MTPIVAIVGRPNVGKSTLFNRLTGKRLAIVHDAPGVTRDRHYADAHVHGRDITLIDTGGFDPDTDDPMGQGIARHVRAAIAEADVVICVLDGSAPPTQADREAVQLLRRSEKPVIYAANKADSDRRAQEATELYELGIDRLILISALHGRGTAELEATLREALPARQEDTGASDPGELPRIALLGRPNAGKSSLFNRLTGSERSLVDARPGTTRDPVDSVVSFEGKDFVLVDTAGVRKKPKVDRGVESASVIRALRMVERAEVVILMVDGSEGLAEQDARLLGLCTDRGRAVIIGLNKADLLDKQGLKRARDDARDAVRFAGFAPVVELSAKTGRGVRALLDEVWRAREEFYRRVPTGELNRFFEQVLAERPPPTRGGRAPRIYYITQAQTAPPVFVAMSNAPGQIDKSYQRFVVNQIRKSFGFSAVPIKVVYRQRGDRS
ncbi:MAG: ribosome biogenesis GTPase Der [Myxococcales bacterium]|nr:ribosome biogenesis GTPase Der [Myxococcales bacterium]MCB9577778.1 ribosome biogenesis GTPase Der [Polyangiaceae bacterium]